MLKTSLIAAGLLLGAAGVAMAQDMRAQYPDNPYGYQYRQSGPEAFGGVNRYCGPGQIPEPFPDGNGVRCALPSGGYTYY